MLETSAMKFRRRVVVVVVAALVMVTMFVLLPVINRTEPMVKVSKIRFEDPNLAIVSLPVIPPPEKIEPEEIKSELAVEKPELETEPELMKIEFDQTESPLAVGDGLVISDAKGLFVPLVAFDMFDLDQHSRPIQGIAPDNSHGKKQVGTGPWARIKFVVETDGTVSDARIDAASNREFGEAGLDAVRNWRFTDSVRKEKSVRTWMVRPFPLRDDL